MALQLGYWGARWLELAPENYDPFVVLWAWNMQRTTGPVMSVIDVKRRPPGDGRGAHQRCAGGRAGLGGSVLALPLEDWRELRRGNE